MVVIVFAVGKVSCPPMQDDVVCDIPLAADDDDVGLYVDDDDDCLNAS